MSTEVGNEDRRYLRAVEKKAGKELFERDEEDEITLYVKKNTATSTHGSAKMEYYVGIVEAEIKKEVDPREVEKAMGGAEAPLKIELGGVLRERPGVGPADAHPEPGDLAAAHGRVRHAAVVAPVSCTAASPPSCKIARACAARASASASSMSLSISFDDC